MSGSAKRSGKRLCRTEDSGARTAERPAGWSSYVVPGFEYSIVDSRMTI